MPARAVRLIARMLGRRGAILGAYGTVWALYGYGQLISPQPDQRGLELLLRAAPLPAWACVWIAAGGLAIACAFRKEGRDTPGFVGLVAIVLPWMLGYLVSWWPLGVFPRGWIAALIWAAVAAPVIVVAGWPEPRAPKRVEHSNEHQR